MHNAKFHKSQRLQKMYQALAEGPKTTRELIGLGFCAVNSMAAELRANGISVTCKFLHVTPAGSRVYQYSLEKSL